MDKQPVGQLPDLTQSNNDDEIMVITDSEHNQLKKEKISDFITDLTSTDANNSLVKGDDGKLFVSKTINASDVDGVLSLDNIPQLSTNKLPETGISADNYSYPSSITVNDRGQVVSIVEGSAAEAGAYLDQSQITNCILEAPNGVATFSGDTITIKQGLKVLIPNGRNEDKTLKNIEYTVPEDKTINYTEGNQTYDFTLLYGNTGDYALSQNYQEADTAPAFSGISQYYLNTKENIMYFNNNNERWEPETVAVLGKGRLENGVIVSFTPYQPVELAKNTDVVHNTGDEEINGSKTFNDAQYFNNNLIVNEGGILAKRSSSSISENRFPFMHLCNPLQAVDISKENLQGNQSLGRFAAVDTLGRIIGGIMCNTANGQTNSPYLDVQARRYYNGANQAANLRLGFNTDNQPAFEFPRCTSRPSTTSTAANNRVAVVVQNYLNGTSWYRVWSDGFIEQGGFSAKSSGKNINFLKKMANTKFNLQITAISGYVASGWERLSTTGFVRNADSYDAFWRACGY